MNEAGYIRSVHRHFPKDRFKWKINESFSNGTPDCFYEGKHKDLFVEYKYLKALPKRETTLIDLTSMLSEKQQLWLKRRHEVGRPAWVVCGSPVGGVIFRAISWQTPMSVVQFSETALNPKEIAWVISTYVDEL